LIGLIGFFFFTWRQFGVDPPKPTVIPRFNEPDSMSPAQLRYVQKRHVDDKAFTSAIISMAVKGAVKIEQNVGENLPDELKKLASDGQGLSQKVGKFVAKTFGKETMKFIHTPESIHSPLSIEEKALESSLFAKSSSVSVGSGYEKRIKKAYESFSSALKRSYDVPGMIKQNVLWAIIGIAASIALVALTVALIGFPLPNTESNALRAGLIIVYVILQAVLLIAIALFFPAYKRGKGKRSSGVSGLAKHLPKLFFFVWAGIFFSSFASILFAGIHSMISNVAVLGFSGQTWLLMAFFLLLIIANIAYFYFIKKPSSKAQKVWSEIEGFDMFSRSGMGR